MRRALLLLLPFSFSLAFTSTACSSSDTSATPNDAGTSSDSGDAKSDGDGANADAPPPSPFTIPCTDTLTDVYVKPASLPAFDLSHRGDVIRCAFDRHISATDLDALAGKMKFTTTAGAPGGLTLWRVAYRTTRPGDKEAIGTGWIMAPDKPLSGAQPLVASLHGTRSPGTPCTMTRDATLEDDDIVMPLEMAARGWFVVAPDYAGTDFDQPPPGYLYAEDEARSSLDSTRAFRSIAPKDALTDQVLVFGHSQGGHATLATQAFAKTYGAGGTLAGVLTFAPPWFAQRTQGAIISAVAGFDTKTGGGPLAYATLYFYSHGELFDGPGGGLAMFQPSKRDAVKNLLLTKCDLSPEMPSLGNTAPDFYDKTFVDSVGLCAAVDSGCDKDPAKTWVPRFAADRPKIDAMGASIVIWQGGKDTTVPADRVVCGVDKINADLAATPGATTKLTLCGDATADHGGVMKDNVDWTSRWIIAVTKGTPLPACPGWDVIGSPKCNTPPPNTD